VTDIAVVGCSNRHALLGNWSAETKPQTHDFLRRDSLALLKIGRAGSDELTCVRLPVQLLLPVKEEHKPARCRFFATVTLRLTS